MKKFHIILMFAATIFISDVSLAQGKWYVSSALQMIGSDFEDGAGHNSFFFYGGLRYQASNYYLSLSIPLVLRSGSISTQVNNTSAHMGGMSSINAGLGDLYLNGSFELLKETKTIPNFSIDGYIKFPTASRGLGIGTGEFDSQIALGIRKFINRFSFFGQFGYLFIGETELTDKINPYTINFGVGYTFGHGEHSILLGYDSYTTIVQGTASPRQLALGYNYLISKGLYFTTIISAGLNSATSDYTISGGINYKI